MVDLSFCDQRLAGIAFIAVGSLMAFLFTGDFITALGGVFVIVGMGALFMLAHEDDE